MAKEPAFGFVIEALEDAGPVVKPMFGSHGVYIGPKIFFILRYKPDAYTKDNGVWVAMEPAQRDALKAAFPALRDLEMFGPGPTGWQNFGSDSVSFEEDVLKACEMALRGDVRIGKLPSSQRKTKPKKKPAAKPPRKTAQKKAPKKSK